MPSEALQSRIAEAWPAGGLESVHACPLCGATDRTLAHEQVRDWSFYAARGGWNYWSCDACASLYLNPRPTVDAIGDAYGRYYTHVAGGSTSMAERLRVRLRNEYWSATYGVSITPRLHLPRVLHGLLAPLRTRLSAPFHIAELARQTPGRLMDVGCGNGYMLQLAQQLGWDAYGLELDASAVKAATTAGLSVREGSYAALAQHDAEFDCIICSHVLEHVHEPRELLRLAYGALRPGGTLLLALPNATSAMRARFGDDWRGLEAPRHITIPSSAQLQLLLESQGFTARQWAGRGAWTATAAESLRIRRRGLTLSADDYAQAALVEVPAAEHTMDRCDFSEFVCVRSRDHAS